MRGAILVVDDQAAQRLVVATVLEPLLPEGVVVREAPSPQRALALLEELGDVPVLVLTDAEMPGMSGLELVEAARRRDPARPERYVLLTAHEGERFAAVRASSGIDAVVTKPVGIDALRDVLREQVDDWQASLRMD